MEAEIGASGREAVKLPTSRPAAEIRGRRRERIRVRTLTRLVNDGPCRPIGPRAALTDPS